MAFTSVISTVPKNSLMKVNHFYFITKNIQERSTILIYVRNIYLLSIYYVTRYSASTYTNK